MGCNENCEILLTFQWYEKPMGLEGVQTYHLAFDGVDHDNHMNWN